MKQFSERLQTLGGVVCSTVDDSQAGIQIVDSMPVMFAGVLCHSAKLKLNTWHEETI
ncbi:MAG: hypothetical protein GY862_25995 [Gammaproteobacteria bacterium]|nr:hypothetical protein [Gammaproteobacteria bacterium]